MKLDRNINPDGKGKYALLKLRSPLTPELEVCVARLFNAGVLDFGDKSESAFFVIRLKDQFAAPALRAYAHAAREFDGEFATDIDLLAAVAEHSPHKRLPDALGEMPPHQLRVIVEHRDLAEKIEKLRDFIHFNEMFLKLPIDEQARLGRQLALMQEYVYILKARIDNFPKT